MKKTPNTELCNSLELVVNVTNKKGQLLSRTTNEEEGRGSKPSISTAGLEGITVT